VVILVSRMVPNMAGCCRFPTRFPHVWLRSVQGVSKFVCLWPLRFQRAVV
jgi:hypothetical protein